MNARFGLEVLPSWKEMEQKAKQYNLEGLETFNILDDETKEREWNGIGKDSMPKWSRELLDIIFQDALPAACIHDFRFVIGGSKEMFYAANSELKRNLRKCLKANKDHYTCVGYQLTKVKIRIAVWLCNKYGYEGWRNKENE